MSFETILFWVFSCVLVAAALGVILARNPVHAALALVLAFVTAAAHWLLLRAEFLAITLVLVYVGAVMVLFLFVVMMLDINVDQLREGFMKFLAAGLLVGGLMVAEMVAVFVNAKFFTAERLPAPSDPGPGYSNTRELGRVLYTDYVFPFELAAVLLLVAIIAAIALTMRKRKDSKFQNPAEQVAVRREDRIKLVSMPAEKAGE
ncbi:MAG: NADH-quinone oxidoreductase subunit J [Burkholderiales bacterium]